VCRFGGGEGDLQRLNKKGSADTTLSGDSLRGFSKISIPCKSKKVEVLKEKWGNMKMCYILASFNRP
jgi:hypothetical protein